MKEVIILYKYRPINVLFPHCSTVFSLSTYKVQMTSLFDPSWSFLATSTSEGL